MKMVTKQQQRFGMNLALQVSPCLTLGLLLIASFGARTVASACDLANAAQRDGQRQQQAVQIGSSGQFATAAAISALTEIYPTQLLYGNDALLLADTLPPAAPASTALHSAATSSVPGAAWRTASQPRAP